MSLLPFCCFIVSRLPSIGSHFNFFYPTFLSLRRKPGLARPEFSRRETARNLSGRIECACGNRQILGKLYIWGGWTGLFRPGAIRREGYRFIQKSHSGSFCPFKNLLKTSRCVEQRSAPSRSWAFISSSCQWALNNRQEGSGQKGFPVR